MVTRMTPAGCQAPRWCHTVQGYILDYFRGVLSLMFHYEAVLIGICFVTVVRARNPFPVGVLLNYTQ